MKKTSLITSTFLAVLITTGCESTLKKIDDQGANTSADATNWSCVFDTKSDLTWERKTESGKRWWNARYTNTTNLGNETPTDSRGICAYDNAGGSNLVTDESCHTEAYVEHINRLALCGYNDWRVPTVDEMQTLLNSARPSPFYNTTYFPYPDMYNIWTGTNDAADRYAIKLYLLHSISPESQNRSVPMAVQLVRGTRQN